ncbi:23S rRNA (pseudouridine(1915)-N(3))-methyltransferase RlmH [Roseinatronobacter monicus]|uniref:Ribosomal RNA large subunit methyltransferase H n=1 Tax=Roseinatronobacter monicus TaxID=393481 RepID=A0A543KIR3_9RHOB|nr:23S rRNA (pseudouridine(1915)-N(3))-methyltransferase RlmH [Roseinatronobacter monicus]TQM94970.1 23S rRNA (pseudouridine1915-N3)-methyltransferase [Roseinatronobacter monicus]
MRLHICAIGRIRKGPERALIDDYITRFDRTGRALSLGPCLEHEIDDRKAVTSADEARLLDRALPTGGTVIALDERGDMLDSRSFAQLLAAQRDGGTSDLAFVIGGADGLDPSIRDRAHKLVSLGRMVWPHMLARVMLCEQIYRASTILAGGPYHRD